MVLTKSSLQTANLVLGLSYVLSNLSTFYLATGFHELSVEIAIASSILTLGASMMLNIAFMKFKQQYKWTAKIGYIGSILLLSYAISSMFVFAISTDMVIPFITIFILGLIGYISTILLGISFYMLGRNVNSMLLRIGGLMLVVIPQLGAMINYIALRKAKIP